MHLLILLALLGLAYPLSAQTLGAPHARAHAHNDYEHTHPLFDALAHGFGGVEADIHLRDGALLVAHDASDVRPNQTLEALYLDPLQQLAQKGGGRIYPGGPSLILLIDIKTEADSAYAALRPVLARYAPMLTRFDHGQIRTNAVTVILSGNRPRATLLAEEDRFAAYDGRLADLGQNLPPSFMPLVSDNYRSHFQWDGHGSMPEAERAKLRDLVARAHEGKYLLRFWATPESREAWSELYDAGVDLLNTDDLAGLAKFLDSRSSTAP